MGFVERPRNSSLAVNKIRLPQTSAKISFNPVYVKSLMSRIS